MKKSYGTITSILFAGTALAGGWYWEVGAIGRSNVELDMRSDSYARMLNLQAVKARRSTTTPSTSDSPLLEDDMGSGARTFLDGAVAPDAMTPMYGDTENWSFDNMSQYNATASTLTFHTASEPWTQTGYRSKTTVSSSSSEMLQDHEDSSEIGLEAKLGYRFYQKGSLSVGLQGALRIYGESEATLCGTAFRQTITKEQETTTRTLQENWSYVYDADFGGPTLLAPRAEGTTGPLYLPSVTPQSRNLDSTDDTTKTVTSSRTYQSAQSDVQLDSAMQLTQIALGPTVELTLPRGFFLGVSPYLTLNLLDFSAERTESFRFSTGAEIASWRDETSKTKTEFGAGFDAFFGYEFIDTWSAIATVGYEDTFNETTLSVGPGEVKADLGSSRFSFGIRHAL